MKFLTLLGDAANASQSFSEYFVLSKKSTFYIPLTLPSEENPNRDPDLFGKLDPYIYLDTNYNLEARRSLAEQPNPQSQLHKAISIIKAANKKKAKYEDAVIILKELHENDPESVEINYQIGYAYSRLKNTEEAEEHFSKVLEKEPNHLLANYELANLYLKNKNYLEALDHYNQVLDILKVGITSRQSWIKVMIANDIEYLAKNLQEVGERDLALNLVERVFQMDGEQVFNLDKIQKVKNRFISVKANEVKYLVGEGKYEEALRFYENLRKELNIQTEFSEIVTDELRSLVQKRNYNEAVEFYQHVRNLKLSKSNPLEYLYGFSLFQKGDSENAIEVLSKLVGTEVEDAKLLHILGRCYLKSGSITDTKEHYELAVQKDPNYLPAIYDLAMLQIANDPKNYEEAHRLFKKAIDSIGQKPKLLQDGAFYADLIVVVVRNLHHHDKKFEIAADLSESLMKLKIENPNLKFDRNNEMFSIRNAAVKKLGSDNSTITEDPKYQELEYTKLKQFIKDKRYDDALPLYKKFRVDPRLARPQNDTQIFDYNLEYRYGISEFRKGNAEEAIEVLIRLSGTEVDDAVLNYNLGRAFEKLEMFDEAKKYYKIAATEREPNHLVSTYNLAMLYLAEEQPNYTEAYQLLLKATQIIDEGIAEHVDNRGSLLHVAQMIARPISQLYRAGRYEEAKHLADRMLSVKSGLSEPLFDKSNELFVIKRAAEKKLLERTGEKFQEALTSEEHFAVYENMQVLINQQKYKKAAPLYDSLSDNIDLQNDEDFLYQGGLIMKNIRPARDAEAIENFRKAYLMRPDKAEFSHQLGTTMLRFNSSMIVEGRSATDYLVEARLLKPTNVFINADLADHCLRDIKDYRTAHQCYSQILEQAQIDLARNQTMTQDGVSYANIVGRIGNQLNTFYFAGQYDMAADLAEGLMQIDPRLHERASIIREKAMYRIDRAQNISVTAGSELAIEMKRKAEYSEARKVYQELASTNTEDHRPHFGEALILIKEGKITEARKSLQDAITDNPKDGKSHYHLATIYQERQIADLAEIHFSKALEYDPVYFADNTKSNNSVDKYSVEAYARVLEKTLSGEIVPEYSPERLKSLCSEIQRVLLRSYNKGRVANSGLTGEERIFKVIDESLDSSVITRHGHLAAANSDFARKDFEKVVKHLEKLEVNPKNEELIDYKAGVLAQMTDQDELALKFYKREIANYGSKYNGTRFYDKENCLLAPSRVLAKMHRYDEAMNELQSLPSTLDKSKKEMTDWLSGTIAVKGTPRETERLAKRYPLSAKLKKEWQDVKSTIPETIPEQPKSWFSAITEFLWPSSSPKNPEVRHLRTNETPQNQINL